LTLEWIEWGDSVQFQKIYWLLNDGRQRRFNTRGYSMQNSNLTKDTPLDFMSHWSLKKTPLNAVGALKIDTKVTLKNSTQLESTRSPINLKLIPSAKISYKTENKLNLTFSPSIIRKDETLTINSSIILDEIRASIQLTYVRPNGDTFVRYVTTNDSGSFSDEYMSDVEGGWSVKAA
jgi:hypothetical protein